MKAVLGAGAGRQTGRLQFAALRGHRQVLMMVKMMKMVVMMMVVVVEMMEATTMDVVVLVVAVRLLVDYDRGRLGGIAVAVTVDGDRRRGRRCWEGAGTRSWLAQAAVQHELQIGPRPASRYWLAA